MTGRVAFLTATRPQLSAIGWWSPWWAAPAIVATAALPQQVGWTLATTLVILLGVPHGALDGEICRTLLRPRFGRTWFALFSLPYMLLFAAVLVAWRLAPTWTLLAFLVASVWHFGSEEAPRAGALAVLVRGGMPVALPLLVHPAATLLVLSTIARVPLGPTVWMPAVGQGWLVLAGIWTVTMLVSRQPGRLAVPALLAGLFVVLPPLQAFAVYFVCVHAPAHTAGVIGDRALAPRVRDGRSAVMLALPITALTVAIGAALWPLYAGPAPERLLSLTLQMLAALTLPHMLLEAALDRGRRQIGRSLA